MTSGNGLRPAEEAHEPSLGRAIVAAFLAAMVILVVAVLPAEYGIDPTGVGHALGLTMLSAPVVAEPAEAPAQGARLAPTAQGPVASYPAHFNVDSRTFTLGPYEYIEFKYHLEKDAAMFFSWQASADVIHDFHGDPDGAPANAAQSYEKRPRRGAEGAFVAPFSGIHGWYWENAGGDTVTIRLTTAGFYTTAREFHYDGSRATRDVSGPEVIPVAEGGTR